MRAAIIAALLVLSGCAAPAYNPPAQASANLAGLTDNQPIINACKQAVFEGLDAFMQAHPDYIPDARDIRMNLSLCYIQQGITI